MYMSFFHLFKQKVVSPEDLSNTDFQTAEKNIKMSSAGGNTLAGKLFELAKSSFATYPFDSLRVAEEAIQIKSTPSRLKWYAFRLYDIGDVETSYRILCNLPSHEFKTASEIKRFDKICAAGVLLQQNVRNAGANEDSAYTNKERYGEALTCREEEKIYLKGGTNRKIAGSLFNLAVSTFNENPFKAVKLAEDSLKLCESDEVRIWLQSALRDLSSFLNTKADILSKPVLPPETSGNNVTETENNVNKVQEELHGEENCKSLSHEASEDAPDFSTSSGKGRSVQDNNGGNEVPDTFKHPERHGRFYTAADSKIAIICDDNFWAAVKDTACFIRLSPQYNADDFFLNNNPDVLFIALSGECLKEGWQGAELIGGQIRNLIIDLILSFKRNKVATAFISSGISSEYGKFIDYASLCDYIFTADPRQIKGYTDVNPKAEVFGYLPFINPELVNPVRNSEIDMQASGDSRAKKVLSIDAGSEYGTVIRRGGFISRVGKAITDAGFDIVNHLATDEKRLNEFNWCLTEPYIRMFDERTSVDYSVMADMARGSLVITPYDYLVNSIFPSVFTISHEEEIPGILQSIDEEELYRRRAFNIRCIMSRHTSFYAVQQMLSLMGKDNSVSGKVSILVVYRGALTKNIQESFERQSWPDKMLLSADKLTERIIENYDAVTWFSDNYIYEEFYLEDMVNAFKYTDASFITKPDDVKEAFENSFVKSYRSIEKTLFWIKDYAFQEILEGAPVSEHGYATDHLNIISRRSDEAELSSGKDLSEKDSSGRLISVIIPVYNTGRQLYGKAVPSLLRSSMFKNMEIIVVDDGSTDRETLLIEDYLARHLSNMVLYRFNDEGSGSASRPRNKGQELATGRYTVFLDSDDEIIDDSLSRLYQDISTNGNVISLGNVIVQKSKAAKIDYYSKVLNSFGTVSFEHGLRDCLKKFNFMAVRLHAMMVKTDFLKSFKYMQIAGAVGEDTLIGWQLVTADVPVRLVDCITHVYYAESIASVTNTVKVDFFEKLMKVQKYKIDWLKSENLLESFMDSKFNVYMTDYVLKKLKSVVEEDIEKSVLLVYQILELYAGVYNRRNRIINMFMLACCKKQYREAWLLIRNNL